MRSGDPQIHVLVSLFRGYGLGDAVQMSAVLRHIRKYRPAWIVDYQAEEGRHQVGRGIVDRTFCHGAAHLTPIYDADIRLYDAEVQLQLFDTWYGWDDRPNTRVSSCLHERLGIEWDPDCGRYVINVSPEALHGAQAFMRVYSDFKRVVAVHHRGDSAAWKKNLSDDQTTEICHTIRRMGRIPLLLDWRNESSLRIMNEWIQTTGGHRFSREWGRDAEMNAALISQCEAFVGVDSGPAKCASATDTPSLVVWTGHHPAAFHDPAPNTTHLVPAKYHDMLPTNSLCIVPWRAKFIDFFEANYRVAIYEGNPVEGIDRWLRETLR